MSAEKKYNIFNGDNMIQKNITRKEISEIYGLKEPAMTAYIDEKFLMLGKYRAEYADGYGEDEGDRKIHPFTRETYAEWIRMNERYGNIAEAAKQ